MNRIRLTASFVFLVAVLCVLTGRLFFIQVIHGKQYAGRSRQQTEVRRVLTAPRGTIFDSQGAVLAFHKPANNNNGVAWSYANVTDSATASPSASPGSRAYPNGELAGTLLGYCGEDGYGLGGVELKFDPYLQGEDGWEIIQKDGRNQLYRTIGLPSKLPKRGCDVFLTIDTRIQKIVRHVLKKTIEKLNAKSGMGIVLEVHSGRILALAEEPNFDPNFPRQYPLSRRINRCVGFNYEPGSTFKIVTAASALDATICCETDLFDGNNGVYRVYDQQIRDYRPFTVLTFADALRVSSNVCFAKIADKIGNSRLYETTKNFGFGARTGIEIPGEESGIVHPIEKWSGRTRVTMAIGQELSVTMLQTVMAFGAIANDGVLLKPRIYNRIVDPRGFVDLHSSTSAVRRVVRRETAQTLRRLLEQVVINGTGKRAALDGVPIGGKTGTSQKFDKESGAYSSTALWSSFVGFTPVERPVLVCGILIDEPADGETGGEAAAPAFRSIVHQILSHPTLPYAEKILKQKTKQQIPESDTPKTPSQTRTMTICSPSLRSVVSASGGKETGYSFTGKTRSRTPHASTGEGETEMDTAAQPMQIIVPDCIGKDLRDAVVLISKNGLLPWISGSGWVVKQKPGSGAFLQIHEVCTLFCADRG